MTSENESSPEFNFNFDYENYLQLLEDLLNQLSRLPPPVRNELEKIINELRSIVQDARPPRFMLLGRRGAGKSSLINAILSAEIAETGSVKRGTKIPQWYKYEHDDKAIEILDTRGLFEGGKSSHEAEEIIFNLIRKSYPKVILLPHKAKEVDSGIQEVLDFLEKVMREIHKEHRVLPKIVGIVTQCDELDPSDILKLPTDNDEKNRNIEEAVGECVIL